MNFNRGKEKEENCSSRMESKLPDIKKRENIRENEVLYITTPNEDKIPIEYGDRFIPRRYSLCNRIQEQNYMLNKFRSKEVDVLQTRLESNYWRKFNYEVQISNLFNIKPKRIYDFIEKDFDPSLSLRFNVNPPSKLVTEINNNKQELDWQCKPRVKPAAFIDSTHDLPGFQLHSKKKIIDWSRKGHIAASFYKDLVIWTCETDKTVVYRTKNVTALRFSPDGGSLALGLAKLKNPLIQVWNMRKKNSNGLGHVLSLVHKFKLTQKPDQVVCIEWDPVGIYILCGMNTGKIYIINSITSQIRVLCHHLNAINDIKFNVNAEFLATSDYDGKVFILKWLSCEIQIELDYRTTSHSNKAIIDWHPWNPIDIAIAMPTSISIVNIQIKQVVAHYYRKDNNCRIDALAFNKISAELVVSYCIKNPDGCITYEILVMASLNRIVDVLKCHENRVKFLLFSPDGKQLATAGDDDMLSIFNFFTHPNNVSSCKHLKLNLPELSGMFKIHIR